MVSSQMPRVKQIRSELFNLRKNRALLTREELADKAGVSARTIMRIEYGEHEPRASTVRSIAHALSDEIGEWVDPRLLVPAESILRDRPDEAA